MNLTAVLTHVKRWEFLFLDSGAIRVRIPPVQGSYLCLFWAGNLNFYRTIAPLLLTERGPLPLEESRTGHVASRLCINDRRLASTVSVNNSVYQTRPAQ
jgi:hypothetical protein